MYKIKVKQYMTKKSTPDFDFMKKWNNDEPMPMRIMVGEKLEETRGMVKMSLHADITDKVTLTCMRCGRPITNKVSQYFGMGPECGGHAYVNPFDSDEELEKAVEDYREKLRQITWTGWIIKSAIEEEINLTKNVKNNNLTSEFEKNSQKSDLNCKKITIRIDKSQNMFTEESLYISFPYDNNIISIIKNLPSRKWNTETKEWEVPSDKLDFLKKEFAIYDVDVKGKIAKKSVAKVPNGFEFKTEPFEHQIEGFNYGLQNDRWLLGDEQGLGKTKQVIDIAIAKRLQKGYKHCLIICGVNGLKWNWQREIETHSSEKGHILGQKVLKSGKINIGSTKDKIIDLANIDKLPYFLITNVESLRDSGIADTISMLCKDKTIGLVAIDEVHKCFDYNTKVKTDIGELSIGYIVENKIPCNVISYNEETGYIEYKPIVDYHKNKVKRKLLTLTFNNGKTIKCTSDHLFYTKNRNWVRADDLNGDDELVDIL